MPYFTKEKDNMLVSLVKSKSFLYRPSVPGYKDPLAKSLAWEEISDKMAMPLPAIRRRWNYIMDQCRKKAQAKLHNDLGSKMNDIKNELQNQMYQKKINGKWCMIISPPTEEEHDEEIDEDRNFELKSNTTQENNTTDDTDDFTDLSDAEDRKHVNISKYIKNGIVIENLDTRKGLVSTPNSFESLRTKRRNIIYDRKQKYWKATKGDKTIVQQMGAVKIENETDSVRQLNGKRRKVNSNNHEDFDTKFECNGITDYSNMFNNPNSLDVKNIFRQKLSSCIAEIEEYKRISNIECLSNPEISPMHKFFEEAASIVAMFPPYLACETSLIIYREIMDINMH